MNFYAILFTILPFQFFSQGIICNDIQIVLNNNVNIIINSSNGNYISQSTGLFRSASANGGTVFIGGTWENNSTNIGFFNDGVTVNLNGVNQTIGGTNTTTFDDLQLTGTGIKQLLNNISVGGQTGGGILALGNRALDLNSNRLTVNNSSSGAITYGSGLIQSETNVAVNPSIVRWRIGTVNGSHVVPFGITTGMVQLPLTFNVVTTMSNTSSYCDFSTRATLANDNLPWAGASNVAAVTNMYCPTVAGNGSIPAVIDRWWDITPSSSITANVTFSYRGTENTMTMPYNTGPVGAQAWSGTSWINPVGSAPAVSAGIGTVTANGLSYFCPYVLTSVNAILPVELIEQKIVCEEYATIIKWSTMTELNNNYYTVKRSNDGHNFTAIQKVEAVKNSNTQTNYQVKDFYKSDEIVYYQIEQHDNNGTVNLFPILSMNDECSITKNLIQIRNNYSSEPSVFIRALNSSKYEVTIYDIQGKHIYDKQLEVKRGENVFQLSFPYLSKAMYLIVVSNSEELHTEKLIIN
jgi:hypothetical protein